MKSFYFCYKPYPKPFELAIRPPKIAHPVPPFRRGLAPAFRPRITSGLAEKFTPNPRLAENNF